MSHPEWRRQAVGPSSVLQVALQGDRAYQIQFEAQPNCPAGRRPSPLTIAWNDERLGEVRLASAHKRTGRSTCLPALSGQGMNELSFAIQSFPAVPSEGVANTAQPVFTPDISRFYAEVKYNS